MHKLQRRLGMTGEGGSPRVCLPSKSKITVLTTHVKNVLGRFQLFRFFNIIAYFIYGARIGLVWFKVPRHPLLRVLTVLPMHSLLSCDPVRFLRKKTWSRFPAKLQNSYGDTNLHIFSKTNRSTETSSKSKVFVRAFFRVIANVLLVFFPMFVRSVFFPSCGRGLPFNSKILTVTANVVKAFYRQLSKHWTVFENIQWKISFGQLLRKNICETIAR